MSNWIFYFLIVSIFVAITSACKFQPSANIYSCYCEKLYDLGLHCENITEEETLTNAYSQLEDSDFAIFELVNADVTAVPTHPDVFNATTTIHIYNSSLDSLFHGVPTTNLDTLVLEDVIFLNGFKWENFKCLENLQYIIIRHVYIHSLDTEFMKCMSRKMKILMFSSTNTSSIAENAFSNFLHLQDLRIESAQVKKLKRNMFPIPAPSLELLSFEDNKIAFLPNDIFTDMPNLKKIDFSYNHITEIPGSIFIIRRNLELISLEGNPLDCSCIIAWFLFEGITWQEAFDRPVEGLCNTPQILNGIELQDLTPEDFIDCF